MLADEESDLPKDLSNPTRRALEAAGIRRLEQIATVTERELLALHGLGPKTIRQLRPALEARGLSFAGRARDPTTS